MYFLKIARKTENAGEMRVFQFIYSLNFIEHPHASDTEENDGYKEVKKIQTYVS